MYKTNGILKVFILIFLLGFFACKKQNETVGGGNNNNGSTNQPIVSTVTPSATNPQIISYNNPHYISLDTTAAPKNKLFIFLPGTSGFPSVYTLIVKKAASIGYHSIGLMYPNGSEIYIASGSNPDNTSFGRCRQEIFDGTDQSSALSINTDNSIKGRLTKLLEYLKSQNPNQNWGQYLINGQVDWSKIVIAGHSQGGGHALYISKKVSVHKAIAFASIDWNAFLGESASWIFDSGATPVSKLYSFNSINDQIFSYANVVTQLNDLGLPGSAVSIDNSSAPYQNSHRLITSTTPAISILVPDHNLICLDQYIPKTTSGAVMPTIDNAWIYLLNN